MVQSRDQPAFQIQSRKYVSTTKKTQRKARIGKVPLFSKSSSEVVLDVILCFTSSTKISSGKQS